MDSSRPAHEPFKPAPSFSSWSPPPPEALARLRRYVGMRVSWGAVAAGAIALLATSVILWALALAVIALATRPTATSLHESMVALYGCALVTTLIGAFLGGVVSAFLRGSARGPVGVIHGLLSWGLAMVLAFGFQLIMMRGLAGTATTPLGFEHGVAAQVAAEPHYHFDPSNTGPGEPAFVAAAREALRATADIGWASFCTWVLAGMLAAGGAYIVVQEVIRRGTWTGDGGSPMVPTPGE
jgi:hypothetical protein